MKGQEGAQQHDSWAVLWVRSLVRCFVNKLDEHLRDVAERIGPPKLDTGNACVAIHEVRRSLAR